MTTSATQASAVRAALCELVDYAGLFPPAKLDMAAALREYAGAREGPMRWMLGRFIVPASRLNELIDALPGGEPVPLSIILDAGAEQRTWLSSIQDALAGLAQMRAAERRIAIEALEVPLPPLRTQRETYDAAIGQFDAARKHARMENVPAFVELPRDARWLPELPGGLFALSRHGLGAKLRCGGVTAQAFPSAPDVAAFIAEARDAHVPFKATAGLHHPVRHRDQALGVMMHGFLNILAASARAICGADRSEIERIVACEDPQTLLPGAKGLSADELRAARAQAFVAYGSCSFSEPVEDLQALGVV